MIYLKNRIHLILLSLSILLGSFLLLYKINVLMEFIGDQGWFYLGARDILLHSQIPLVSMASSHPWLHQGALWTYLLAISLWIFNYSPLAGGYLSVFFAVLSIYFTYIVGRLYISKNVGVIASLLFATSPLLIINARMPYHTSPIPLLVLFFLYALYKFVEGNKYYLPVIIFLLALLYNFELATFTLSITLCLFLAVEVWKKASWVKNIADWKVLVLSAIAFVIPMLPMLLYDAGHGYPQTIKFMAWIGYHILRVFGYPSLHPEINESNWSSVVSYGFSRYSLLVFVSSSTVSFCLMVLSFITMSRSLYRQTNHERHLGTILLGGISLLSIIGYIAAKTPSDAYFPVILPTIILVTAFIFEIYRKKFPRLIPGLIACLLISNVYSLLVHNYYAGIPFTKRTEVARKIVAKASNKGYTLTGRGEGSQFPSYTMNYQYLTWLLGNQPSIHQENLQFVLSDKKNTVDLTIIEKKKSNKR